MMPALLSLGIPLIISVNSVVNKNGNDTVLKGSLNLLLMSLRSADNTVRHNQVELAHPSIPSKITNQQFCVQGLVSAGVVASYGAASSDLRVTRLNIFIIWV
ncbi:hypothetical protein DM860_004250 [Cuscuta australis]|uniref:Uncharacterized protein n=1 Tax=Cuscuta australis TaxID=267555 RepID=A0A328EAZ8_9ASTE|nr:hypothetical protein DM860_004250 [Cuscuta australis]